MIFRCNFDVIADAFIGLDQESYTVNEADGSVTLCVVFLMNSGIQDSFLTVSALLSTANGTATGIIIGHDACTCT